MADLFDLLRPTEQRAVLAILTERTLEAAARASDIHERTLRKWLATREPFKAALREQKRVLRDHVSARAHAASSKAVDTLIQIMEDSEAPPAARVSAARAALEFVKDTSLDERLEALEAVVGFRAANSQLQDAAELRGEGEP